MSHPVEYYLKYLFARAHGTGSEEDFESINYALGGLRLPKISEEDFSILRATFAVPDGFQFFNRDHLPTVRFMKLEKIYAMWMPSSEEDQVFDLLDSPLAREKVQILLMNNMSAKEIAERVNRVHGTGFSSKAVEMFRHYFWNVPRASASEWEQILWSYGRRDHYMAALLGSRSQALYRAGFSPKIDGKVALREAHRALYLRIEATRSMADTKEMASMLTSMTKELVAVHHALYGEGAGVEEQIKDLQKHIRMRRDAPNVVPLKTLAPNNNFSQSGGKKEKKEGA